jgi:hypothetical protein
VRALWRRLPGPMPLKLAEAVVLVALALVVLGLLFEWAGDLLDSGGVVGG